MVCSFITAANTPAGQKYGYVFRDCILPANNGTTTYYFGKVWAEQGSIGNILKSHTKVVFIITTMNHFIRPEGWI